MKGDSIPINHPTVELTALKLLIIKIEELDASITKKQYIAIVVYLLSHWIFILHLFMFNYPVSKLLEKV